MTDNLTKIIQIVNGSEYQAEFRPVLSNEVPTHPPEGCELPPFINPELVFDETPVPKLNKPCTLSFLPIPVVPIPYVDIPAISQTCPDGVIIDTRTVNVIVNDRTVGTTQLTRLYEDNCSISLDDITLNLPGVCETLTFNTADFFIQVNRPTQPTSTSSTTQPQYQLAIVQDSINECQYNVSANIVIDLPYVPCETGYDVGLNLSSSTAPLVYRLDQNGQETNELIGHSKLTIIKNSTNPCYPVFTLGGKIYIQTAPPSGGPTDPCPEPRWG